MLASKSGDYDAVRSLVYDCQPYKGMDAPGSDGHAWEFVVWTMKNQRRENVGDWSYSDDALGLLLEGEIAFRASPSDQPGGIAASIPPEDLLYFERSGCHVWVVRLGRGWQLLFWEGMNELLR